MQPSITKGSSSPCHKELQLTEYVSLSMGPLQPLITIQTTDILHFTYGRPSWFDGFTALCCISCISCHIRYWQLPSWMYRPLVLFLLTSVHIVQKTHHGWESCWIICCFLHFYTLYTKIHHFCGICLLRNIFQYLHINTLYEYKCHIDQYWIRLFMEHCSLLYST